MIQIIQNTPEFFQRRPEMSRVQATLWLSRLAGAKDFVEEQAESAVNRACPKPHSVSFHLLPLIKYLFCIILYPFQPDRSLINS